MGQISSSTLLLPDGWGSFQAGGEGSRVLQQASKGRLDLSELHPLLLLYTSHSGHSVVHVLAREGHVDLLREFVELLQQHAAELADAVSSRLQEEDAKQAVSWWKPSQVLPWPRGPGDQVQQLQEPSLVVPTLLSWQNSKGVTPLMLACRAGHAACVAVLLDNGADPLLLDKATRRSCLHYAAAAGHVSCVNVLLNEFRTLRVQQSNGSSSLVPLQAARVRDGVEGYTKFVDLRTTTGFAALHYTAFWGHTAVVRALLTGGASVMLQTANRGRGCTELLVDAGSNALHLCAENGHVMVAATLLMAHAEAMAQRYAAPLQQQQQRQQQQQQPWEGRARQDPRAACNSTGHTPGALALAARRSKALLLLLDPALPLSWVLTTAGLMGSGLFGAPKLAVLAKAALDKHLISCLDRLECLEQQKAEEQAAEQLAAPSIAAAAAICSAAAVAAAASGAETSEEHGGSDVDVAGMHAVASSSSLSHLAADAGPADDAAEALATTQDKAGGRLERSCSSDHEDEPAGCNSSLSAGACCSSAAEAAAEGSHSSVHAGVAAGSSCCMGSLGRTSSQISIASSCGATSWQCSSSTCGSSSSHTAVPQPAAVYDACDAASSCCEMTCNICFDSASTAMVAGCRHCMCVGCARSIVAATTTVKPAACPFCRQGVAGFLPV